MRPSPRRYKILHPVGKGAFGTVYRAKMLGEGGFHKEVAIKLMNLNVDAPDEVAQRQRDEARLLGLIRHRAILQVDGLVRLNGSWAVVMEYIDGINLRELLRFGPVPASCALQIVGEVAGALNVAWDAKGKDDRPLRIIHRDIKPPNIQLTAAGEVKLLDFGVARADFDTRESETIGVILGTLRYMAPERLDGIDGPKGDVYALGVVLVELLTRKPMLKTSSSVKRHAETVGVAIQRVSEVLGDSHRDLVNLVEECLAYEPDQRPNAEQLERRCWGLLQDYPLPRLREWASIRVREAQTAIKAKIEDGGLSGETLMEQSQSMMLEVGSSTSTATSVDPMRRWMGASLVGLLLMGFASMATLGGIAFLLWGMQSSLQIADPTAPILETHDPGDNRYPIAYHERDGQIERDTEPQPSPPVRPPRVVTQPTPPTPTPASDPVQPKSKARDVNSGIGHSAMGTVVVQGDSDGVKFVGAASLYPERSQMASMTSCTAVL